MPRLLRDAGVVVTGGRISAVGELSDLRRQFGDLPVERHAGLMLPGLVNAHTHLELSHLRGALAEKRKFPEWVMGLMEAMPREAEKLEAVVRESLRVGIAESLRFGVTTVGDIARNVGVARSELAADGRLRAVSFGEVVSLGKMRERLEPMLQATVAPFPAPATREKHILGISPHAPYTVEGPSLRACIRQAIIKRAPVTMHLAEHADEGDFLRDLSGSLGHDWPLMEPLLDFGISSFRGGPIRWAQLYGLLVTEPRDFPVLLAHVNYCDDAELAQLASGPVSVAYCPRTHEFFGHSRHRYRDMLAAAPPARRRAGGVGEGGGGINVCLGTDSLASAPDLSVLREAQLLVRRDGIDPYLALDMITRRGAVALGMEGEVGTLGAGKCADLAIFPAAGAADGEEALARVMGEAPEPTAVYVDGRRV